MWSSGLQKGSQLNLTVYNLPSLWYFVIAADNALRQVSTHSCQLDSYADTSGFSVGPCSTHKPGSHQHLFSEHEATWDLQGVNEPELSLATLRCLELRRWRNYQERPRWAASKKQRTKNPEHVTWRLELTTVSSMAAITGDLSKNKSGRDQDKS